ncbi:MAG TPA: tetratricopeptide repeat protein [Sphingomicrobium sp.]|nr:tetratricopeptide repeat protein [Sphingomicrobium sp.]
MADYGVREAAKLLDLRPAAIRALIRAGFVSPARGPRNAWRFSFQDLIVLRTARALASANVPARRITRSMKELRRRLPPSMPLSGLSVCAGLDGVVVKEGSRRWQAESGQYLLGFEGDPADGSLRIMEKRRTAPDVSASDWFERGETLESADAAAAIAAYRRALAAEPGMPEASINLGKLLHDMGRLPEAEHIYREAVRIAPEDPTLLYNLGLILEDTGRKEEAIAAYEAALRVNPRLADCCYNLALLCEALNKPREAIRYMAQYRRLLQNRK